MHGDCLDIHVLTYIKAGKEKNDRGLGSLNHIHDFNSSPNIANALRHLYLFYNMILILCLKGDIFDKFR